MNENKVEGGRLRGRKTKRGRERRGSGGKREQERRQTRRRVRLQLVFGSHSAIMHSADAASNWTAEGQVGWWEREGL